MSESREGLDFSTVIASTLHDMKNSLAMLTQTHNQWIRQMPEALLHTREHGVIEYEFARLNGENPMYCEDAARRILAVLDALPWVADYAIEAAHLESLHPHDAVARVVKGVTGGFAP